MRKTILFAILLITIQISTSAQNQFIILNGGITKPLSNFADNDFENTDAGFATNGFNFGFEMAHFFSPWFGLGGSFKFSNASFDSQKYNTALYEKFQNKLDTIHITSGDYNLQNFLFGPYGKVNFGDYFSLFGNAFIGVLSTYRPDQTLNYKEYGGETQYLFAPGKLAAAFAWNFSAGFIVKFSDSFGIIAKADYIAANPQFDVFDYQNVQIVKETQSVRYVNYNIGIAFGM